MCSCSCDCDCEYCCDAFKEVMPSVIVIIIMMWSYCTYVIHFCIFQLGNTIKMIVFLVVYHVLFIMMIVTYFFTMFYKDWYIPDKYYMPTEIFEKLHYAKSTDEEYKILLAFCNKRRIVVHTRTSNGNIRVCSSCGLLKPDRAHHCSTCEICVLKMDHHCPWINNCVGFTNYKYFIVMVMYSSIYCTYYVATTAEYVYCYIKDFHLDKVTHINVIAGSLACFVIGVVLWILFVYHMHLICVNETTLESMHSVMFAFSYPVTFSKGHKRNFRDSCGYNCILWCLPVNTMRGDGCNFDVQSVD